MVEAWREDNHFDPVFVPVGTACDFVELQEKRRQSRAVMPSHRSPSLTFLKGKGNWGSLSSSQTLEIDPHPSSPGPLLAVSTVKDQSSHD